MNRRADEIRKRIAERKRKQLNTTKRLPQEPLHTSLMSEEENMDRWIILRLNTHHQQRNITRYFEKNAFYLKS